MITPIDHFMTVGRLKRAIENLPDDAPVLYERIEDSYFEPGKGWQEGSSFVPCDVQPGEERQFIHAYGAYGNKEEKALLLTAHY